MRTRNKWRQGYFKPRHPEKYNGSLPIVYRSGLELKVMRFFDENRNVISWGSESIIIPYLKPTDNKVHRYYLDFDVTIRDGKGNDTKYIIEVKPYKQTLPPKNTGRKSNKTLVMEKVNYSINMSKWKSAREWAEKHGYVFNIITEKDIDRYMKK